MLQLPKTIMILGSGELGKEFVISAKRLGLKVIAVDRYKGAPAQQVADAFEAVDMLDGSALQKLVDLHKPDIIVPEIEAIRTEKLREFEQQGIQVVPTAEAAHLTMNRDAIREVASKELKLKTAKYDYAEDLESLKKVCDAIGFPCVIKPIMSSSGKGQSVAKSAKDVEHSWKFACEGMRGDRVRVIAEEFIHFESEITLLTVRQQVPGSGGKKKSKTIFVAPIGHRQERGDYQESWLPARVNPKLLKKAQAMAKKITDRLGGSGIFGVEFFLTKNDIYFSELSPRPHDTGMVTLISQNLSEFDLHLRAILGLPISEIEYYQASASAVILAHEEISRDPSYKGLDAALKVKGAEIRIFGKPNAKPNRRMGVALARAKSVDLARKQALKAASAVSVE